MLVVRARLPTSIAATIATEERVSCDATHAYLNLTLNFSTPAANTLSGNQNNVANALINYFNTTGGIPLTFATLSAPALSQASGETATGGQQTTFNAMTQFMGMMTDPFSAGRGGAAPGAIGFADEGTASAYASTAKSRAARDAYAMFTKAPLAQGYDPRWSVWASGFGGAQTTDGNAATGSNTSSSRIGGVAVGVDYRFAPNTSPASRWPAAARTSTLPMAAPGDPTCPGRRLRRQWRSTRARRRADNGVGGDDIHQRHFPRRRLRGRILTSHAILRRQGRGAVQLVAV
jgi:hypothetical protein